MIKRRMMIMAGAAMMTVQSVAASASPVGLSSNRAALGLPVASAQACDTTGGRAACATDNASELRGRGGGISFVVLILALAAIGAAIYIAVDEDTSPNSP